MSFLKLENLHFSYQKNKILQDFNLGLPKGEIHCILGPSGCGKSTLLHLIAGILQPDSGHILLDDRVLTRKSSPLGQDVFLPPEIRHLGVIFQEHCLFPHLNVADNICFGMKGRKDAQQQKLEELLELIRLPHKKRCFPEELSGGEQQRVAIARAIASNPKMLLMDEPFSALDVSLRGKLRRQLKQLLRSYHLTTLLVTHSHEEAFELGDRVTVLNGPLSYQTDLSQNLFFHPQNISLVEFMKSGILVEGLYSGKSQKVKTSWGTFKISNPHDFKDRQRACLFVPFQYLDFVEGPFFLGEVRLLSFYSYGERGVYTFEAEREIRPRFFELQRTTPLTHEKPWKKGDTFPLYLKNNTPLKALTHWLDVAMQ